MALDESRDGDVEVESDGLTFLMHENEAKGFLAVGVSVDFTHWPGGGSWRVLPNLGVGYGC